MNKDQLKKSVGFKVQLRPVARTRDGHLVDRDWTIRAVDDLQLELDEPGSGFVATLCLDHVYSFMTNPKRDSGSERYGFLLLHVQLILDGHTIHIEPLPGPRSPGAEPFFHPHSFSPLILEHEGLLRYFSWRGRDPLHLIHQEEIPRQLFSVLRRFAPAFELIPDSNLNSILPTIFVVSRCSSSPLIFEQSGAFWADRILALAIRSWCWYLASGWGA